MSCAQRILEDGQTGDTRHAISKERLRHAHMMGAVSSIKGLVDVDGDGTATANAHR